MPIALYIDILQSQRAARKTTGSKALVTIVQHDLVAYECVTSSPAKINCELVRTPSLDVITTLMPK